MTTEQRDQLRSLTERLKAIPTPPTAADKAADDEAIQAIETEVVRLESGAQQ